MADAKLVDRAMSIEELAISLQNISTDDKCQVKDYTDQQILAEAKYVLDCFVSGEQGHINNEAYCGKEGPDQRKWAVAQVGKLRRLLARFDPSTPPEPKTPKMPDLAANMRVKFGAHEYVLLNPAGPRLGWRVRRVSDGRPFRLGCSRLKKCQFLQGQTDE